MIKRRDVLGVFIGAFASTRGRSASASLRIAPTPMVASPATAVAASVVSVDGYLAQAALLLDETRRAQDWVGSHPTDRGLIAICHPIAELRSTVASAMAVPAALKNAHMNLLLVLENTTAAFDAKLRGDDKKFAQRMSVARTEEQTLNLAYDAAKVKLPSIK